MKSIYAPLKDPLIFGKIMDQTFWKKCSTCKKEIAFSTQYYLCSVSTCKHKRKGFRFCSVACWDAHLGFMNHREAWAEEAIAPSKAEYLASEEGGTTSRVPKRTIVQKEQPPTNSGPNAPSIKTEAIKTDTLVVVSKVKNLIKEQSGFSTSQCCVDALTSKVVDECLKGIENAKVAERKTVMGRDIK